MNQASQIQPSQIQPSAAGPGQSKPGPHGGRSAPPRYSSPPAPAPKSGFTLIAQARAVVREARAEPSAGERFRLAHLAALRCAAAVLAERARPGTARRRPTNAWVLLSTVAPELSDWARYFAAGAPQRAAVEAGAINAVTDRDADDLVRAVEQFLRIVESGLGLLVPALAS